MATPANPIANPITWTRAGRFPSIKAATTAANSGTAPLIIPAREEEIHCWATGKRNIGTAIHVTATSPIDGQSCRGMGRRAAGNAASVPKPSANLPAVMNAGSKDSRLSAMRRNDDPQTAATAVNRAHSAKPNALACVPGLVPSKADCLVATEAPKRIPTYQNTAKVRSVAS